MEDEKKPQEPQTPPAPEPKKTEEKPKPEPPKPDPAPAPEPTPKQPESAPAPDNSAEIAELKEQLVQAEIKNVGLVQALSLGIDAKTAEAVIKLADLSAVTDKKGKANADNVKTAINKVLEEFPALKPTLENQNKFVIGGNGGAPAPKTNVPAAQQVAQKRWNRFK